MKRYPWRLIAFLALVLMFSVIVGWAAMTLEVARSKKTGSSFDFGLVSAARHGTDWMPVIRVAAEYESWRSPTESRPLVRREQFAILPDPVNGRELVDRIVAAQAGEPVETETDELQTPRRVYQHQRIGPGYVVPVGHGV